MILPRGVGGTGVRLVRGGADNWWINRNEFVVLLVKEMIDAVVMVVVVWW